MKVSWNDAVLECVREFCKNRGTTEFSRQEFLDSELPRIIRLTGTLGNTPDKTTDATMQRLRDEGYLAFIDNKGTYRLLEPCSSALESIPKENTPPVECHSASPAPNRLPIPVFCADIGSVRQDNFGWFGLLPSLGRSPMEISGSDIRDFAATLASAIREHGKASVGFECPLFIPLPENPDDLTSARPGEGTKPWSVMSGPVVLSMGLNKCAWVFGKVFEQIKEPLRVTFDWEEFVQERMDLHIWEAFVSGKDKTGTHKGDAELAVRKFMNSLPSPETANAIDMGNTPVFSLAGAALLRSGLSTNIELLEKKCLVIKP